MTLKQNYNALTMRESTSRRQKVSLGFLLGLFVGGLQSTWSSVSSGTGTHTESPRVMWKSFRRMRRNFSPCQRNNNTTYTTTPLVTMSGTSVTFCRKTERRTQFVYTTLKESLSLNSNYQSYGKKSQGLTLIISHHAQHRLFVRPLTDDPSFLYEKLVRESCTRNLYIQVAHRTIQVSRVGNMADDKGDDLTVATNP